MSDTGTRLDRRARAQLCGGPAMGLLRPEELEQLVCGRTELDFAALQEAARYEAGFTPDTPVRCAPDLRPRLWVQGVGFRVVQRAALCMAIVCGQVSGKRQARRGSGCAPDAPLRCLPDSGHPPRSWKLRSLLCVRVSLLCTLT